MTPFSVFVIAGIGTYVARASFVLLVGDRQLPDWAERIIRNVGGPVLAALATSLLVSPDIRDFVGAPPRIAAVVVAIVLAWRTRNFIWSFFGGMAVLWTLEAISR